MAKQSCCRYLSDDLLEEILSRSSVKSLLRFRCVCNSWLRCINDPKFARLHLSHYNISDAESDLGKHLRVTCIDDRLQLTRCNNNGDAEYEQFGRIPTSGPEYVLWCGTPFMATVCPDSEPEEFNVLFVVDGLIVLSIGETDEEVMLWNPWIRKIRRIRLPEIQEGESVVEFGIGFSSAINDYKFVTMHITPTNFYVEFFAVYTLGTDSWKIFEFPIHGCSNIRECYIPVCLGGFIYALNWYSTNRNVLSFDLDNDRFGCISLPDDCSRLNGNGRRTLLTLGDRGRSLALVQVCHDHGSIWIRQSTSWAKSFSFSFTFHHPVSHYVPWPILLHLNTNGELLLAFSKVLTLINLETKEEKTVPKTIQTVLYAWGYRESLLMLN